MKTTIIVLALSAIALSIINFKLLLRLQKEEAKLYHCGVVVDNLMKQLN